MSAEVVHRPDCVNVELWYPRSTKPPHAVEVDLVDVRAADPIRITFDFERNGWLISREVEEGDGFHWVEAAFVRA